jgi:acyl-CoA thioester hydrolase
MIELFEYPHTVSPDEIDEQGRANNVVYVSWMQDAAVAHSAVLGWTPERYLRIGMGWVARSHWIEYLQPAMAGDEIIVETRVSDMKKVTSKRVYRILRRTDGTVLAKAETNWAFVNYATGKPTRIPPEIADAFPLKSTDPAAR